MMYPQTYDHLAFNYGQDRAFGGKTYVFARGSSNASTGWVPLDAVVSNAVLAGRIGEVNAKDTGGARMGCYQVRASHDASIAKLKVVRGDAGPEADDYLAIPRTNGKRYANLVFNLPGDALGGPAVDIFESGTRFQRIEVPTETGRPSLDVKLYALDDPNRFTGKTMKFIYGFVRTDGTQRFGWMAMDALSAVSSTPCP